MLLDTLILFLESCEGIRRTSESASQAGYQKRNRDLISWAKRRRHHIRREDLLAYLAGKPPPPKPNNHHRYVKIYVNNIIFNFK